MFRNVGSKIKIFAIIFFFFLECSAISTMAVFMTLTEDVKKWWIALAVILVSPLVAWISSVFIYGFGQLIENSDIMASEVVANNSDLRTVFGRESLTPKPDDSAKIKELIREKKKAKEQKASDTQNAQDEDQEDNVADNEMDADCEPEYYDLVCPKCKHLLSFTVEEIQGGEQLVCPLCDSPMPFNDEP